MWDISGVVGYAPTIQPATIPPAPRNRRVAVTQAMIDFADAAERGWGRSDRYSTGAESWTPSPLSDTN